VARLLSRGGRYHEVHPEGESSKSPAPLAVKEVLIEGRRYIVFRNSEQERKEAVALQAMIAALEERIKTNPKGLSAIVDMPDISRLAKAE
jgi:hypothetical protein